MRPRHDLDDGALAATVLTEKMVGFAGLQRQVDTAQGMDAAKPFLNILEFKERCRTLRGVCLCRHGNCPHADRRVTTPDGSGRELNPPTG